MEGTLLLGDGGHDDEAVVGNPSLDRCANRTDGDAGGGRSDDTVAHAGEEVDKHTQSPCVRMRNALDTVLRRVQDSGANVRP